jgi:hypothetical protein
MVKALSLFSSLKENIQRWCHDIFCLLRVVWKVKAGTGMHNVKLTVRRTLENGISYYRKMYEEIKKATSVQTTLHIYF